MKRKWLGLALAAAVACAGAATAAEYTDSSLNYPDGWNDGSNGGTGFGAWQISANSGSGYAGGGIWETGKAEVSGDVVDANGNAFGIIGKGDGSSFTATRNFRAPLAVGDSFEFDMAVNWDCGYNSDSKKGIALLLDGKDAVVINHDAFPGPISVNGFWDNASLTNYGTGTMHWTILAKDETTVTVTGTARDGVSEPYSTDIELPSSALTGFRLQSALQKNGDEPQEDADKRQSYFNNFKLTIAGELPELVTLGFSSGEWAVSNATQALSYTLTRSSSAGALDITVSSSDESFVAGKTVSFADGEAEISFTLDATLTGSGNYAKITASATGCDPASYEVRGPQYRLSVEKYEANPDETINFWMNWDDNGIALDEAKVTIEANPADSMTLPTEWTWNKEEGGAYVASSFTAIASGKLILKYDGVQFADYGVTVVEPSATLSGPTSIHTGTTVTYTADITLGSYEEGTFRLTADSDLVTIEPESVVVTEDKSIPFQVTAGSETGTVILTLEDDDGIAGSADPITVTITEAPDYSDYIAYDDASFYGEGFDFAATGVGIDGFQAWSVYKDSAEFGGAIVTTADGGFPAILSEGSAFAIYANGSNPDYAIVRPFVNDLQPGQKASIEFVVPQEGGSRYIQFARIWEGTPYNRFEIWANGGKVGVNVDSGESQELSWAANARRVVASVQRAADGSEYTLALEGYNEGSEFADDVFQYSIDSDVGSWGDGLQGIVVGGYDLASDFIFNKLAIEQVEEPVKVRAIGFSEATYNPDVAEVPYKFAIGATTDDIGVVNLSVTPDDGGLVLSVNSVDLTGVGEAEFTVTVSAEALPAEGEGTKYTITATPVDESVAPATYDVTPRAPYIYLSSDNWEYDDDQGAIWVTVHATPSHFGTYYVTIDPAEGVLGIPEFSHTIEINAANQDACAFDLTVVGAGEANVYIAHEGALDPSADFHFLIHSTVDPSEEPAIDATTVVDVKFSNGFSGEATGELEAEYQEVKAQVLKWNGVNGFDPIPGVEPLENQATWPEMKFDLDDPNAVLRFIFKKK